MEILHTMNWTKKTSKKSDIQTNYIVIKNIVAVILLFVYFGWLIIGPAGDIYGLSKLLYYCINTTGILTGFAIILKSNKIVVRHISILVIFLWLFSNTTFLIYNWLKNEGEYDIRFIIYLGLNIFIISFVFLYWIFEILNIIKYYREKKSKL